MAAGKPSLYKLRVSIDLPEGVPEIWREVEVRGEANLAELNSALQESFGWSGIHKHEFVAADKSWKATNPQYGPPEFDQSYKSEEELTVDGISSAKGLAFTWNYDMTDAWTHNVEVVEISESSSEVPLTRLTNGARAGIPEDVGGASGFQEFLQSLDPEDPEHNAMAIWYRDVCLNGGAKYNPDAIDFDKINKKLAAWSPA